MHCVIRQFNASIALLMLTVSIPTFAADTDIRINSIGFLPQQEKRATIAVPCTEFRIIRLSDDSAVYTGTVSEPMQNRDTNEDVYIADFSSVTENGEYVLEVPDVGRSATFRIAKDVYNHSYLTAMKGMYLWRCGTAVSAEHNGITFSHEACHLQDAYTDYVGERGERRDGTKGWHDAGDYNKYIVNAGVTVGAMFHAWEQFPHIHDFSFDFPESNNGIPDFLDEMKWELEWVLTMQADDGSVYHKLSTTNFGGFIMPENEGARRFFVPWGSAATADFVAMTAMAARIFKPYDAEFADRCAAAAVKSYDFLAENPQNHAPNQQGFSTGGYGTNDPDDRIWAAAEMWQTFGEEKYLTDFESRVGNMNRPIDTNWDWSSVKNLGMFTYLLSERDGRDPQLVERVKDALIRDADSIVDTSKQHGYERPLGTSYYWGCNGTVARQTMNLMVAHKFSPKDDYVNAALAALGHLFGRNYYCRSYVTGLGLNPPLDPHDRRSGGDRIRDPWPGYLVGGGHTGTGWVDVEESYETNEIAINWNGALIYALAAFTEPQQQQSGIPFKGFE